MGFPTVVPDGQTARLWYTGVGSYRSGKKVPSAGFRIGYAVSSAS